MILDSSPLVAILTEEPDAELFIELSMVVKSQFGVEVIQQCAAPFPPRGHCDRTRDCRTGASRAPGLPRLRQGPPRGKLNFGDCFAYALAKTTGEPLLFKGEDFKKTDVVSAL